MKKSIFENRFVFLSVLTLAVTALLIFTALPTCAKTTRAAAYAITLYGDKADNAMKISEQDNIRYFDMTEEWDFYGDAANVRRYTENGFCTACAILDTNEAVGETVFTLELSNDLSEYNVVCFGIECTFVSYAPSRVNAEIRMTDYSGNRVSAQTYLKAAETDGDTYTALVCFDISEFAGRDDAATFTVTLTYDPNSPPDIIRIANPYAMAGDNEGFNYAERYLTNSLKASVGAFGMKSGAVRPDERGNAVLAGSFVLAEQPKNGSDAFLELCLSHVTSGGLTVTVSYDAGNTENFSRVGIVPDKNGRASVILPFTVSERLADFELSFDGMTCDGYFKLDNIILHSANTGSFDYDTEIGRVNEMNLNGNTITFSGVMERDSVREYGNASLCFYAVPGWSDNHIGSAVEIGRTKMSTRFDCTVDLSDYAGIADAYMFFAAVCTDDGDIIPLSRPAYPTATELSEKTLSNIGLYGAAAVGVFESNTSHVIVDVPLDRLLNVSDEGDTPLSLSYTVYSPAFRRIGEDGAIQRAEYPSEGTGADGTEVTVIETSVRQTSVSLGLLRELDSEINFYISAGLEVYLRLSSETVIPTLTYSSANDGANHYAVLPDSAEGRYLYVAVLRLLCRRYDNIAGFVMGYSVNNGDETGDIGEDDIAVYAKRIAEVCRLTYNAASSEISDIIVVVPFDEGSAEDSDFRHADPVTLNAMMSMYIDRIGNVPWAVMYCTDELYDIVGVSETDVDTLFDDDTVLSDKNGAVTRLSRLTDDLGFEGSCATFYFYEPSYETIGAGYEVAADFDTYSEYLAEMFARLCESTHARAVFLSLAGLSENIDHEFYSCLKKIENAPTTGSGRRSVSDFTAISATDADDIISKMRSSVSIWDFTNQFYPLGWIAGGGVESCLTIYSDLFGETEDDRYSRVLRSVITLDSSYGSPKREGTAAGIVMRNLSRSVNLEEVGMLTFTLALNHPGQIIGSGDEGGTVVFIIGSDDCRAEFTAENVPYGQIRTYVCDLTEYEFSDKVDYMGILVYGNHETYLDLSCVNACSETLAKTDLADIFAAPISDVQSADTSAIVLVSGIVFVVSVSAAILLIRHDFEEKRERAERQNKRERIRR